MAAPPPVSIAFFPERRQLAALARQIHTSRKAYPLLEVASLVMSKPEYYQVKIESPKGQGGVDIVQCKVCGTVALDESTIIVHAFREHMADFFEVKEEESPEPAGQFPCVARCGLSGVLLGPPNHHSYAEKVREVHAARYPAMPIEEYRRRIETVRDEALVAQWKSENKVRKTYLPKGQDGAEQMDRTRAEAYFRENAAPGLIAFSRRVVLPAVVAQGIEDSALRREVGQAWQRETRFPRSVLFALRAALKHMRLHVFRAGKGISFVTHTQPSALDPDRAVESIGGVLRYLSENPGSTRSKLVEALKPGEPEDSPAASEILSPLTWLIERGHIIEFFNGTLSVPLGGVRPAQPSNAS
ncbi:MAG: hypothetical protein FJ224_03095 [Lentisphaerae bacterium]|nr:hypothetical protein [Lentisphaerota bacterium]